jgi:hypothetical protein
MGIDRGKVEVAYAEIRREAPRSLFAAWLSKVGNGRALASRGDLREVA